MENCGYCGIEQVTVQQYWCGVWEDLIVCPECDIATDKESGIVYLQ